MDLQLKGKKALVTGSTAGIGFATAEALVARGASVVIVDLDQAAAERAAGQLHDVQALGIGADVTDRGAMQRAVATAVERLGGLDVVVANDFRTVWTYFPTVSLKVGETITFTFDFSFTAAARAFSKKSASPGSKA